MKMKIPIDVALTDIGTCIRSFMKSSFFIFYQFSVMWFTSLAEKYGFSAEQSLALLHINKYNMEAAKRDLNLFMPLPSQWTQDKAVFVNAVREEEKFFYAIKDKFVSVSELNEANS